MRTQRNVTFASLALMALGMLACQARPIPLSAQVGSTITLPLSFAQGNPSAFGGSDYTDVQRGEYVFALVAPAESGGIELTTRFVMALNTGESSVFDVTQHIAVIDLVNPQALDLPLGTQTLYASHRASPGATPSPLPNPMTWQIAILPEQVEVEAGGEIVTGTATPNEVYDWFYGTWTEIPLVATAGQPYALDTVIPRPAIRVGVAAGSGGPIEATSIVAEIAFPDAAIEVLETGARGTWYDDLGVIDETRRLRVSGAAMGGTFKLIPLVFELKGATPLALGDVGVTVVKATDTALAPIASPTAFVEIR